MGPLPEGERLPDRDGLPEDERTAQQAWRARHAASVEAIAVHRVVASPRLSAVVLARDADATLVQCLQHLRRQTVSDAVPYEIILADNGGNDRLRPLPTQLCDVELRLRAATPVSQARNIAVAWARGEHVALIDDDGLVEPSFVDVVCRTFEDRRIAAMRGRVLPLKHPYLCTLAEHYDRGDDVIDDALVTEGCMAIRRRIHLRSGGFPEQVFGHEGLCLTHRVRSMFADQRVVYVPGLVMRHDYVDGIRSLVAKLRRHEDLARVVAEAEGGGALASYLANSLARRMPRRPLPLDRKAAWLLLLAVQFLARRVPSWALPGLGPRAQVGGL